MVYQKTGDKQMMANIYRGYNVNYQNDGSGKWEILKDEIKLHSAISEDEAYNWIDKEKRRQTKIENM